MTNCLRMALPSMVAYIDGKKGCYLCKPKEHFLLFVIFIIKVFMKGFMVVVSSTNHNPRVIVRHYLDCVKCVGGVIISHNNYCNNFIACLYLCI